MEVAAYGQNLIMGTLQTRCVDRSGLIYCYKSISAFRITSGMGQGAGRGDVGYGQKILEALLFAFLTPPGSMQGQEGEQAGGNQKGLLGLEELKS